MWSTITIVINYGVAVRVLLAGIGYGTEVRVLVSGIG